jgi:hypothetical protein
LKKYTKPKKNFHEETVGALTIESIETASPSTQDKCMARKWEHHAIPAKQAGQTPPQNAPTVNQATATRH